MYSSLLVLLVASLVVESTHAAACFLFPTNKPVYYEELVQVFYFLFQMPDVTRDASDDTTLLNPRTCMLTDLLNHR